MTDPAGKSLSDRLDAEVAQLINRLSLSQVVADASGFGESISRHIEKLLDDRHRRGHGTFIREDPTPALAVSRFMKFACGARSYDEFTMKGEDQRVRPNKLFLFASQSGLIDGFLKSRLDGILESELSPLVKSPLSIVEAHGGSESEIIEDT